MYSGVFVTAVVFKRIFSLDDDLSQKKGNKENKNQVSQYDPLRFSR